MSGSLARKQGHHLCPLRHATTWLTSHEQPVCRISTARKFALLGIAQAAGGVFIALELGKHRITVNAYAAMSKFPSASMLLAHVRKSFVESG